MNKAIGTLALLALLSACGGGGGEGGNPVYNPGGGGGDGGDGGTPPVTPEPEPRIPAALARNVSFMAYNASSKRLQIQLTGLDHDAVLAEFTAHDALNVPGYQAFISQDDPLDRMFTALAATSFDGAVTAGVAADGGQFTKYFPGGYYVANEKYVAPKTTGLASYAGNYAAVTNTHGPGTNLKPVPPGTPAAVLPAEAALIDGMIFVNIQFGENLLNGTIYSRQRYDENGTTVLPDVFLLPTELTKSGTFAGSVGLGNQNVIGSYGGVLGGAGGTSMAGVVATTNYNGNSLEEETGVFVLSRCGTAGAHAGACSVAQSLGQ